VLHKKKFRGKKKNEKLRKMMANEPILLSALYISISRG
jgi:hypothetical protein